MDTLTNLFHTGGALFMGILTILLLILLATAVIFAISIFSGKAQHSESFRYRLTYLKVLGLFTMIFGILGQLIGLLIGFGAIERAADISPQMMYGGLKISFYTTVYGILVYLLSILLWFILDLWYHKKQVINE
ncbi:MAG: MotA/TolQ/ExbB proton channel family protein [Bacteroides sp.]|nr:MotA/TolQ/ExbB proton channel family protein [Bacteroides sp.]